MFAVVVSEAAGCVADGLEEDPDRLMCGLFVCLVIAGDGVIELLMPLESIDVDVPAVSHGFAGDAACSPYQILCTCTKVKKWLNFLTFRIEFVSKKQ